MRKKAPKASKSKNPKKAKSGKKRGSGKGKKLLLFFVLPLLLLGGTAAGLILTGKVKVPFYKPKTAPLAHKEEKGKPSGKPAAKVAAKPAPKPVAKPPTVSKTPLQVTAKVIPPDPAKGTAKVAKLWNEIDIAALQKIIADWNDTELAPVLLKMDSDKVAELLAQIEPRRASSLIRAMRREASRPVVKPASLTG